VYFFCNKSFGFRVLNFPEVRREVHCFFPRFECLVTWQSSEGEEVRGAWACGSTLMTSTVEVEE